MGEKRRIELSLKQSLAWQALESQKPTMKLEDTGEMMPVNHVSYGGAAGGGKSWFLCAWHINRRITYPNSRGAICKDTQTNIRGSILLTFFEVAKLMGYEMNVHYTFNSQLLTAYWFNGSITFFKNLEYKPSDPDFHRLGGLELTDAAVDEAQTVSEKAVNILASRIRHMVDHYKLPTSLLITCNPGPHWVKHKFIKTPEGEPVDLPHHLTHIQALLTDNPDKGTVRSYMAQLQTLSEYDKSRLLYGDWDAEERTGGEFYSDFHSERNVKPAEYDPSKPLHLTFDFNVHPYVTLLVHQLEGKDLRQIDEFCLKHPYNRTKDTCQVFLDEYTHHAGGVFVYGDPSGIQEDTKSQAGHNDYSLIRDTLHSLRPSMRVAQKAPPVHMRGQFINALFRRAVPGCTFTITPGCRETIKDYQNVKQAADGTKEKKRIKDPNTGITYEPLGHASDANDYLICEVFHREFKQFQKGRSKIQASIGKRQTGSRMGF